MVMISERWDAEDADCIAHVKWNHRVILHHGQGASLDYLAVHEVHYNEDGEIVSWSEEPVTAIADDAVEMAQFVVLMRRASLKPTLVESEGKLVEVGQ
jgi:hypothetical protein